MLRYTFFVWSFHLYTSTMWLRLDLWCIFGIFWRTVSIRLLWSIDHRFYFCLCNWDIGVDGYLKFSLVLHSSIILCVSKIVIVRYYVYGTLLITDIILIIRHNCHRRATMIQIIITIIKDLSAFSICRLSLNAVYDLDKFRKHSGCDTIHNILVEPIFEIKPRAI